MTHTLHSAPCVTAAESSTCDTLLADSRQARYFRGILDAERAKLDERLANDMRKLAAVGSVDEAVGAKALRRRIRVMQRRRDELDCLIRALDRRF